MHLPDTQLELWRVTTERKAFVYLIDGSLISKCFAIVMWETVAAGQAVKVSKMFDLPAMLW